MLFLLVCLSWGVTDFLCFWYVYLEMSLLIYCFFCVVLACFGLVVPPMFVFFVC